MSQVPVAPRSCPHCGAELAERAGECWLCKARLGDGAPVGAPSPPRTDGDQERTFSLSTLMLVFTGAGVCLCLCAAAPGLGIPVSVTLAPALMRAYAVAHQERVRGKP